MFSGWDTQLAMAKTVSGSSERVSKYNSDPLLKLHQQITDMEDTLAKT
jgi:hypothetical protein